MTEPEPWQTARAIVLSAIEEQIMLARVDDVDRLVDPNAWHRQVINELITIRRDLGTKWGWPEWHGLPTFDESARSPAPRDL